MLIAAGKVINADKTNIAPNIQNCSNNNYDRLLKNSPIAISGFLRELSQLFTVVCVYYEDDAILYLYLCYIYILDAKLPNS